ncbi:MAG: integrase domain-containing protein [Gammaproteobacteria bacterium]|nr:integrase domain-containing protein [Gammaproteobacteria bacterium]
MPRITKPLSETEIKHAKPKDKPYSLADGKGLYLKIKPSGYKVWLFNYYKPFTKKRVADTLGEYPTITLAKARSRRNEYLKLLADDIDPIEHKLEKNRIHAEKSRNTLEAATSRWIKVKSSQVSDSHAQDIYRSLELHILPALGKSPLHKIRAKQVIEVLEPLAAKGSLETVKRLIQRLNEIMVYAVNTDLVAANCLSGVSKAFASPQKSHMPSLSPEQLPELMRTIANASIKKTTRCLIEWQLHTMTRPGEAAGTRWEEIDLEKNLWAIPAARMKKKRPHKVPLSSQMLALLEVMKPISANREHVFPADRNPRTHANPATANMALKRMGYGHQLVAHGLRALASTTLNEQGFDHDIIESALAHTDKNDVRGAYNRAEYLERRRIMMRWWSDYIESAAEGNLSLSGTRQLRAIP